MGRINVHFTICVRDRKAIFRDETLVRKLVELLEQKLKETNCDSPVYCFMPNHLHLLVRGRSEDATPKVAIDKFKLSAGIWLGTHRAGMKLQHDYYDHIIRSHDDWREQAQYIARNPVRAGLVENPLDYPFTGCIGSDWKEMSRQIFLGW